MLDVGAFFESVFFVLFKEAARSGANAEARSEETCSAGQCFVMLSGKREGSSTTKTSDSSRRPSWRALFWSSLLRVSPRPSASPGIGRRVSVIFGALEMYIFLLSGCGQVPVLRQRIFRWLPSSGLVRARTVGAKNIASSSGWAIRRHIRLFWS